MKKFILLAFLLALGWAGTSLAATDEVATSAELAQAILNPASTDITLKNDITLGNDATSSSDIPIDHELTIRGSGKSINGNNLPIFNITAGLVTFENITFTKGGNGNGTAISITGTPTVAFTGVKIDTNTGLAVSVGGGTVTFDAATSFSGNKSGAVSVTDGEVTFNETKFDKNEDGGAVNVTGGKVTFNDNSFTGNTKKTDDGGAVNATGGEVTFSGTARFENNEATTGNGGALNIEAGATVTFGNSMNFTGNKAANGGAIATAVAFDIDSKFKFTTNTATTSGGALHSTSTQPINVSGESLFTSKEATGNGGAIHAAGAVNVSGGAFNGNKATGEDGNGGAIHAGAKSTISGGTFSTNTAGKDGGAFYGTGTVDVKDGTFNSNAATGNGGAIYAGATGGKSTISGGTFNTNTAASGGAFYGAADVTVTAGTFNSNKSEGKNANDGGGAIYAGGNIEVKPADESMTFTGQTAQNSGGALYSSGDITLTDVILTKNETKSGPGGATYSGSRSTFTNCVFEDNTAGTSGGASYAAGLVNAEKTTFRLNNAAGQGSGGQGGAVFAGGRATNTFDDCFFQLNQSNRDGGAVFVTGDNPVTEFRTSVFDRNTATGTKGGAASLSGASVLFSRCTFTKNSAQNIGNETQGGAVFTEAADFRFANCTFVENEVGSNGKGGALSLAGGTTEDSVIFYCTFTDNVAGGGQGGAVYTSAATVNFVASAFVGNTADKGYDVFRNSGSIMSSGYNILGDYGMTGTGQAIGGVDWTADGAVKGCRGDKYGARYTRALLFGSNTLADNVPSGGSAIVTGSSLGETQTLQTLATAPTTEDGTNEALDWIPEIAYQLFKKYFTGNNYPYTDARGLPRPNPTNGNCDVGAYESEDGSVPSTDPPGGSIAYVSMSGIPNTMIKIGQTCSLTALVYYRNGSSSSNEAVTWSSSNPSVAAIDPYGNLVSLMRGKTTISVTTERVDANNRRATDSAELEVSEEWSYTNVHADVWKKLGLFNNQMQQHGEQLHLVDADPLEIQNTPFATDFKSAYGVSASQVSEFLNANAINFNSKSSYAANNWASAKPSISVSMSGLSTGSVLPLEFTYSLSWSEVREVMGEVTEIGAGNVTELFRHFKLLFESADGTALPLVDADGEFGISATQARSSGVLAISNGNNGVTLKLKILLADVQAADDNPQLIDDQLVVADGVADKTAAGSLWLLRRTDKGGNNGGNAESGGGGCNTGGGFVQGALWALWGIRSLKRRSRQ